MNARIFTAMGLIGLAALGACRKEKDTDPPVITVSAPSEGTVYQVPATIPVQAGISDEKKLESVRVQLVDENQYPLAETDVSASLANPFDLSTWLEADDIHLETGTYYVRVSASDGVNTSSRYIGIKLLAVPKVLEKVLLVTTPSPMQVQVSEAGATGLQPYFSLPSDYQGFSVSSYHRHIAIAGSYLSDLVVTEAATFAQAYRIPSFPSTGYPYFLQARYDPERKLLLTAFSTGQVRAYDRRGFPAVSVNLRQNHIALYSFLYGDKLITAQREVNTGQRKLALHFTATNTLISEQNVNFDVAAIEKRVSDGQVFIFLNEGSQGKVRLYDQALQTYYEPMALPAGRILAVVKSDQSGERFYIAHETGIYRYSFSPMHLVAIASGVEAQDLAFDTLSGTLYAASGNSLFRYSDNGILLQTWVATDSIKAVDLLYNK